MLNEIFQYGFMRNALIAILLITPMFGLMGTMIVNKKMAFFSDALGHSALTGIGIGVILGVSDINLAMIVYAVIFALVMNLLKRRELLAADTAISVFSSASMALGLAILSRGGNFSRYSGLMVGDILSVTPQELPSIAAVCGIVLIFWLFACNWLHAVSINETLAKSVRIPVKLVENLFAVVLAVMVMLAIRWVGALLINAMLILPAASSRNLAVNVREYHFFAILFSVFSGVIGLILSFALSLAAGPAIVLVSAIIFACTYVYAVKNE